MEVQELLDRLSEIESQHIMLKEQLIQAIDVAKKTMDLICDREMDMHVLRTIIETDILNN